MVDSLVGAKFNIKAEINTQGCSKMENVVGMDLCRYIRSWLIKQQTLQENGSLIKEMDTEKWNGPIKVSMKANG